MSGASWAATRIALGVRLHYDYLILATGATHSYFGHEEFRKHAPGLKNLADAVAVRNKILSAFEVAEAEEDPRLHRDLLTFVLVGAGPTGVEMASAIAVLVRNTLRSEFRRIDPASARIVLVDQAPRVLGSFSEELSSAARKRLEELGVEVLSWAQRGKGGRDGRDRRGRADRQQYGHLDRGSRSVAGRQVAECRIGSRRTGARSKGPQRGRTSGNLCGRGHGDVRGKRQAAARRGAGGDATRAGMWAG